MYCQYRKLQFLCFLFHAFVFLFLFLSSQFGLDSSFLRKYNFFKHLEIGSLLDGHFPVTGTTPGTLRGEAGRMIDASLLLTVPLFICHLLFTSPVKFQLTFSCLKQSQGEGHMLSSSYLMWVRHSGTTPVRALQTASLSP